MEEEPRKKSNTGRKALELDVAAMWRMRQGGKSDAEVSRKFKCSSKTVASRLRDYTPPIPPPPPKRQPQPTAVSVAAPKSVAPTATFQDAPLPVPPGPEDNADELIRRHEWLAEESAWRQRFFLVNAVNPLNLQFCNNNSQHGVALAQWHESFRGLEVFENATRIWVVIDPADDNQAFLQSLVDDITIREKCLVAVGKLLDIAKFKTDANVGHKMPVEIFEVACGFRPMPQPNHVEVIRGLLEKPTPPETPQSRWDGCVASESWRIGGNAHKTPSGWKPKLPSRSNPDGSGNPNDGLGVCF
jgi:hypothetical protein